MPQRANDESLLAWQTDNELNYFQLGLATYLGEYAGGAGGAACIAWLQAKYLTLDAVNAAWNITATTWAGSPTGVGYHLAHDCCVKKAAVAEDDNGWIAVVMDE